MKKLLLIMLISTSVYGQDKPIEAAYDFWVGEWDATWDEADGKGFGTNIITKELDDKVIRENFSIKSGQYAGMKGTSISVYNPQAKTWHQAWADNNGFYFDFYGKVSEDKKMFITHPKEIKGQTIIQRMVFYDIKEDSFMWDWEISKDGGETWTLNWQISYTRKK